MIRMIFKFVYMCLAKSGYFFLYCNEFSDYVSKLSCLRHTTVITKFFSILLVPVYDVYIRIGRCLPKLYTKLGLMKPFEIELCSCLIIFKSIQSANSIFAPSNLDCNLLFQPSQTWDCHVGLSRLSKCTPDFVSFACWKTVLLMTQNTLRDTDKGIKDHWFQNTINNTSRFDTIKWTAKIIHINKHEINAHQ